MDETVKFNIPPGMKAAFTEISEQFERGFISAKELEDRVYRTAARFRPSGENSAPPPGVHDPGKYYTHTYNDCSAVLIDFPCSDTALLPEKDIKEGEKLVLKNELGLEAVLYVKGHIPRDVHWYCTGTIEGYTALHDRKFPDITVFTDDEGAIYRLGYMEDRADEEAFDRFPLWRKYYEWHEELEKKNRELAMRIYNSFIAKNAD